MGDPVEISLARRRGDSVWLMDLGDADDHRHGQHQLLIAQKDAVMRMPQVRTDFVAATDGFDAFDVLAAMQLYMASQPEMDESTVPELVWATVELAAMLLLERPSSAPPDGAASAPLRAVVPYLFQLLDQAIRITSAVTSRALEQAPDDVLAEIHERFVGRLLLVPINESVEQAKAQLLDVFSDPLLDAWLTREIGFSAVDAVALADAVTEVQIVQGLFSAAHGRAPSQDVDGLGRAGSFTVAELAAAAGVTGSAAAAFVDQLGQRFGRPKVELPTLTMQMRHRPLIQDVDGRILAPVPHLVPRVLRASLTAAANPAIPAAGPGDQAIFDRLTEVRGKMLEQRSVGLLASRLRADRSDIGLRFSLIESTGRREGEVDGIVALDDVVIVVQAKSGSTRIDAVAGQADKFEGVVRDLVTEAMRQHDDARRLLSSEPERVAKPIPPPPELPVRDGVYPITVTLEDLSGCAPFSWKLRDAGLATDGPLPWIVALAPMEIMLDLVQLPAQFVHFLKRRSMLNDVKLLWAQDEIDIFLEYLHDRLTVATIDVGDPAAPKAVLPPERFHALDRYLIAIAAGEKPPKPPRMRLHPGVRELLERLDRDRPAGWLRASLTVLDAPISFEHHLGAGYLRLVRAHEEGQLAFLTPEGALLLLLRAPVGVARIDLQVLEDGAKKEAARAHASAWVAIALPARRGEAIIRVSAGDVTS